MLLEPQPAGAEPELISDGGGLPFPPSALARPAGQLDPADPAVEALAAQLARQKTAGTADEPAPPAAYLDLDGWRILARTEDEVLFGHGRPGRLITVAMALDARHQIWRSMATNATRPLRATRDGIRASRWRLDPAHPAGPEDTVLRILVTEQTFAGGKRAGDRLLAPDLYVTDSELVLTIFITPRPGFQTRSQNPETPARVVLPSPLGTRTLVDGALYPRAASTPETTPD